jgi:hypothetical protein
MRIFAFPEPRRARCWPVFPLAVAVLTLGAQGAAKSVAHAASLATANAVEGQPRGNIVIEWNRPLLDIVRTPQAQPTSVHPTSLDHQVATDLAGIPNSRAKQVRIQAQRPSGPLHPRAARARRRRRRPAALHGRQSLRLPADPAFLQGAGVQLLGQRRPIPAPCRPPLPPRRAPGTDQPAFTAAINEVKTIGAAHSMTRTAEQTTLAKLWTAPPAEPRTSRAGSPTANTLLGGADGRDHEGIRRIWEQSGGCQPAGPGCG